MADEVIIEEYSEFKTGTSTPGTPITTQVLDIATASAALNAATRYVRIQSKGTAFWYKFGGSTVSAVADTNGNLWLPADQYREHYVFPRGDRYIDTAADA